MTGHRIVWAISSIRGWTLPRFLATGLLFLLTAQGWSQQKDPVAVPSSSSPTTVLQVAVRRITVDVVVTDSKGKPVRGLKREDFQVFEDGTQQMVRSFDAHTYDSAAVPKASTPMELPPHTYANLVSAPESGPVTVLLYDVLNTPTQSMPYAHDAMVKFIKSQPPGSRTAIFVLGSKLRMLQGFTDDETRLLSAINSKSSGTQQSSLLLNNANSGISTPDLANDNPQVPVGPTAVGPTGVLAQLNNLETMENILQYQERIDATVEAFAEISRFLAALPGRKNLLWLSGSFPGSILPSADPAANGTSASFGMTLNADREIKIANDLLNAAHVAVYPVDVRGLQTDTFFSAASNAKVTANAPPRLTFSNQQNAEHSTMDQIADNTGGHAFYNTNGLNQAMQSAMEQGSVYYTLTYSPTNKKFDGLMRRIRVQLDQQGYTLSYRKTYFADAATPAGVTTPGTRTESGSPDPLTQSMRHGAPISTELFFVSSVNPVEGLMDASEKEAAQLSQFAATPKKKAVGSVSQPIKVQHYEIAYSLLGRMLDMPPINSGKFALHLEFAVAAFDDDGLLLNGLSIQVQEPLSAEQHDQIKGHEYRTKLNVVVPQEARWIRIAVQDVISGRNGSLEIAITPTATHP